MRFEWNALRVGDEVRVHLHGGSLRPGTVAFVDTMRGSYAVGIRVVGEDSRATITWPSRLTVHAADGPVNSPGEPCLRCTALDRDAR
jgi:hypothetical protein